ncbi:hypothetical protein SDRG_01826 [Saprolegnia diclina VS20]|uniref:Uncharacterized protein n=1 Tax=Saprolegnia diclina (strain VS20) TaxID=1156394 RepID=T0R332_SAPDV|nr:hypothetical protein SDRG_01826 [Saprolegnia diclina VS20]EQC40755.1 hypothetical protein SDRG_01826 [Saprolegnia diclina VS20]|eukprot:XP_008605599.1 hypothetical protein SDRG_01826 [Saprolegnia diclina VS20]
MASMATELRSIKGKLEKALAAEPDPFKWTSDAYEKVSTLLDDALENDLGDPRDRNGVGATTIVQAAHNACIVYERHQIKLVQARAPSPDVVRLCNGKQVIGDECLRILNGLNAMSSQTFTDAVVCPELNGPILDNPRIDIMARDMRARIIKIRMAYRRIDGPSRLEEGLRMTAEATRDFALLEAKVGSEVESRQRAEADARNNMDRTSSERNSAVFNTMQAQRSSRKNVANATAARKQIAPRASSSIESLDLQHLLASQLEQTTTSAGLTAPVYGIPEEDRGREMEAFAQSLFMDDEADASGNQMPMVAAPMEATPAGIDVKKELPSKLRAKREERERDRRNKLSRKAGEPDDDVSGNKHAKMVDLTASSSKAKDKILHGRRSKHYKLKNEADKRRLDEVSRARADVEEGDDDTDDEKVRRAEARKFLMKYDGDIWSATKTGKLDVLQKYFLIESPAKLLVLHNRDVDEGRRTLLHTACWSGHVSVVEYLLRMGADVDAVDSVLSKTTPLIEAARAGRLDVVKLLLSEGACVSHQDFHGDTPLHWAARRGWNSLVMHMVRFTEQSTPGSVQRLLSIENYHGYICVEVAPTSYLSDIIRKEFAFVMAASRDQRRATRQHGLTRMRRASMHIVAPKSLHPSASMHDVAFENVIDVKAQVLHDLAQLGLNLNAYSYSRA